MKRSFSIIIVFVALAIVGCALVPRLPVKLMPSKTLPGLSVSFSMPNATARVVESEVTSKLEGMLARIQGVKEIYSTSSNGSGHISIGFDKHTDMEHARFEASSIVRQAWPQLPEGVSYPYVSANRTIDQSARPILTYTLNAPGGTADIMRYAEENLRPAIGRLRGVSRVDLSGATPMEWRLTYDNDKLEALGLRPDDITAAIAGMNASEYLGTGVTEGGEELPLRCVVSDSSRFDISAITLFTRDSVRLRLDQLVTAIHRQATPTAYFRINGLNSIYCDVYAEEDANQLEVAARVKEHIAALSMPKDYALHLNGDTTEHISSELDKIYFRTGLTLFILLLFVALITLNLRYIVVITLSLLMSLAISVIFYYVAGIEIQLYSLAGITISLNLIIDNIIVMSDHHLRWRDLRAFTSVLAATLTTIGALGIVFFLDDDLRLNLQDFVVVVIINLTVSLGTALFLVPALIKYIGLDIRQKPYGRRRLRGISRFNRYYGQFIGFTLRRKWIFIVVAVLGFGLPTFLLPDKIDGQKWYNDTIGTKTYQEKIRPWVDGALGGTLRLFVQKVFEGSYFNRGENEPTLSIYATLPNGATLEQMNELIKKMEAFLSGFPQVKQFRTDIYSPRRANISVTFTKAAAKTGFPYQLKSEAISKALTLGGGSWSIYGLEDQGFSNSVTEGAGNYRIKVTGYNYDELETWAERVREKLLEHKRIKEVTVNSDFSWYKEDYTEFFLDIDRDALARQGLTVSALFSAMAPVFGRDIRCGTTSDGREQILLGSIQSSRYDVWSLMNVMFTSGNRSFKLADFATVSRVNAPHSVAKENQQYRLCIQYEYIGSYVQAQKLLERYVEEFRQELPLGYFISSEQSHYHWGNASSSNYWLLLLVVGIIFFITSIQFNSVRQPLIIIFTIPVSFIGVFLIFYLTKMNFDQGGFCSFVLLCGITVNASIYLLNEYNHRGVKSLQGYLRAFNAKIIPILLTVISTILGFIPFMIGTDGKEGFWFPLALGTTGGLAVSLIAIIIYLPLFSLKRIRMNRRCSV